MAFLMILLLIVPAAAAGIAACLGPTRAPVIRWLSLGATLATALIATVLAIGLMDMRGDTARDDKSVMTFTPEFVPGADPARPHATSWRLLSLGNLGAVQFYLGLDGLNVWLILL